MQGMTHVGVEEDEGAVLALAGNLAVVCVVRTAAQVQVCDGNVRRLVVAALAAHVAAPMPPLTSFVTGLVLPLQSLTQAMLVCFVKWCNMLKHVLSDFVFCFDVSSAYRNLIFFI